MKTKEFVEKIEALGYSVAKSLAGSNYLIRTNPYENVNGEYSISSISTAETNKIDTTWEDIVETELFDLLVEYAKTPIEEREEPKLYTARHKFLEDRGSNFNTLKQSNESGKYFLEHDWEYNNYKAKYTEKELKNINGVDVWNSPEWEIEEVPE